MRLKPRLKSRNPIAFRRAILHDAAVHRARFRVKIRWRENGGHAITIRDGGQKSGREILWVEGWGCLAERKIRWSGPLVYSLIYFRGDKPRAEELLARGTTARRPLLMMPPDDEENPRTDKTGWQVLRWQSEQQVAEYASSQSFIRGKTENALRVNLYFRGRELWHHADGMSFFSGIFLTNIGHKHRIQLLSRM